MSPCTTLLLPFRPPITVNFSTATGFFANYRLEPCSSRVLRFHRVQSRQSENRWRLDRPYCGGDCCNIPCLVDAATLCDVVPRPMLVITKSVDTPAPPWEGLTLGWMGCETQPQGWGTMILFLRR